MSLNIKEFKLDVKEAADAIDGNVLGKLTVSHFYLERGNIEKIFFV